MPIQSARSDLKRLKSPLILTGKISLWGLSIIASLYIVSTFLEIRQQRKIASQALDWMQYQSYPDNCGYQGEFPYGVGGMPCFTKSGYRFVSGSFKDGDWATPFRRIVKIKPDDKWTMEDVILSWESDWRNQMQLYTGSSADLEALLEAIPEIGLGWPYPGTIRN
jgi:hypothetical protein